MGAKATKKKEELKKNALKAVVLTDDFELRLMPLTATTPRCLLPLANVPLIEYTLEFLATSQVDQVFLYCSGRHMDKIERYIASSRWVLPWAPFKIKVLKTEARSVGDVMRDLDARSLVSEDFVLVAGDVVTNISLQEALDQHKKIKAQDKDHIATMVMTAASALNRSRPYADDPALVVLEPATHKCLAFDSAKDDRLRRFKKHIQVDLELLEDSNEFDIRNDLIDCRIDICTTLVPALYLENFDFQHCRRDFVRQILQADLLGRSIYVHIASGYAARVSSYMTYRSILRNVIERYVYPVVPQLPYEADHVYKHPSVVLAQLCKVGPALMVGAATVVGDDAAIEGVVIGAGVRIGKHCKVLSSILFEGVVLEDNVEVRSSILGAGVVVKAGAVLDGAIVGADCVVDAGVVLPENIKLIAQQHQRISEGSVSSIDSADLVGVGGTGVEYSENLPSEDSDTDLECYSETEGTLYRIATLALSDESLSLKKHPHNNRLSVSRARNTGRRLSQNKREELSPEAEFDEEGYATIERAIDGDHDLDTAVLEINTLRMSLNVDYACVRRSTLRTLLAKVMAYVNTNTLDVKEAVNKIFPKWGRIFERQLFEPMDQIHLLDLLNELCLKESEKNSQNGKKLQFYVLQQLYEDDLIEENYILYWYGKRKDEEGIKKVDNPLIASFADWLENAEEESESEDEDEE